MTYKETFPAEVGAPPETVAMPEPKVVTPEDILLLAAEIIEERGWVRRTLYEPGIGFCAIGAIRAASGQLSAPYHTTTSSIRALAREIDPMGHQYFPRHTVETWNDKHFFWGKRDVIKKIRKAANFKPKNDLMMFKPKESV